MVVTLNEVPGEQDEREAEEGPFELLCYACRIGNVSMAQRLISDGVDVNEIDEFDYSPLILASLCGHYDMVFLLLESGAICEGASGERCLYNALNDRIRNLLLEYDYSKSSDPNIAFSKHISSLFTKPGASTPCRTSDLKLVALNSNGHKLEFHVHKFILAARCPVLAKESELFQEGALMDISAEVLDYILRYVYLYEIPETFGKIPSELQASLRSTLPRFQLYELLDHAERQKPGPDKRPKKRALVEQAQNELLKFYEDNIIKTSSRHQPSGIAPKGVGGADTFADIILRAEPEDDDTVSFYPAHRAMLRCEYFETMFKSGFKESHYNSNPDELPVLPVMMTPRILELVLMWFYTDSCDIPIPHAMDLLYASDMLFIDALKLKAAGVLATAAWSITWNDRILHGDDMLGFSIFDLIRTGWELKIRRLEEFGAKFLAERLEDVLEKDAKLSAEFEDLIKESAARITEREDTDTIEIIDDLRFYLSERFRMRQEDLQANQMFTIDEAEPSEENGSEDLEVEKASTLNGEIIIIDNGVTDDTNLRTSTSEYEKLTERLDEILEKLSLDA